MELLPGTVVECYNPAYGTRTVGTLLEHAHTGAYITRTIEEGTRGTRARCEGVFSVWVDNSRKVS